jgi:hypothetical protein
LSICLDRWGDLGYNSLTWLLLLKEEEERERKPCWAIEMQPVVSSFSHQPLMHRIKDLYVPTLLMRDLERSSKIPSNIVKYVQI